MTSNVKIQEIQDSSMIPELKADVIVDSLIGIGFSGKLKSPYKEMVEAINNSEGFKIAVDVPSGFDPNRKKFDGEVVKADLTITFHKSKRGFENASEYLGELKTCPIGIPPEAEIFAGPGDVFMTARKRPPDAHKGDFGRLLVIGGSETYSGAPALTGMAAYASGVDLVYVAAPEAAASIIAGFSPSLITVKLKGNKLAKRNLDVVAPFLEKVDAVAIGPGLGAHSETFEAVNIILRQVEDIGLPVLVDADALKAFAGEKRKMKTDSVFTPHQGEFKILTGGKPKGDIYDVGEKVRKEASNIGATILLKGNTDVVSDGLYVRYNRTGNPGMTVGGTGDVLSGIVAGLMSKKAPSFNAAVAGAFINGAAGDSVYAEKGYHLKPSDLITEIPKIIEEASSGRMREVYY